MFPAWGPDAAYALVLFLVASLEAVPLWGRYVPGHLGFAAVACIATAWRGPSVALFAAALAGAFLSDVAFYAWYRLRPLRTMRRHGAWWRAGLDVDDLSDGLARAPLSRFLAAKFSTRDRARLAYASGKAGMEPGVFLVLSLVACVVWSCAWTGLGTLLGWIATVVPPAWAAVLLAVAFVAMLAAFRAPSAA
jgi:membrane protein DedA with SNARE-associated domain